MSGLLVYGADLRDGGVVQMREDYLPAWADELSAVDRMIVYANLRLAELVPPDLRRDGDDCETAVWQAPGNVLGTGARPGCW